MNHRNDPTWDRWDEVDGLFARALEQPPHGRQAFLAQACEGDLALFRAVLSLLVDAEAAKQRLSGPGAALVRAAWARHGESDDGSNDSTGSD